MNLSKHVATDAEAELLQNSVSFATKDCKLHGVYLHLANEKDLRWPAEPFKYDRQLEVSDPRYLYRRKSPDR